MTFKTELGEVITAMVTPFKVDESVDYKNAESLANYLLQNGTDCLLLTGSTGEAAQLSDLERETIVKSVRKAVPKGAKIMVSTGSPNTQKAINNTLSAFERGADAALVAVPEYIKPPQQALLIHFNSIAKAAKDKPIIIYNIPSRTGTEILPETVAKLAKTNANIIGIKQSFGNLDKVSEMKMLCPEGFQIYSGDDSLTLPMMALGAKGVISVASHLEGKLIKKMIQEFKTGHVQQAQKTHALLFPLFKTLFMTTNPLPIKEALYQRGLITSPTLRTMGEMQPEDKKVLQQNLQKFETLKKLKNMRQN